MCPPSYDVLADESHNSLFSGENLQWPDSSLTVAEYLAVRLKQLGIKSIHGVPGGYNLHIVDSVCKLGLKWVGNCNELNAGYAADGYARIIGIGAVVTTFGVGELSAINAFAGAYAERIPLLHIVGTPSTELQSQGALLHHSLGNGSFHAFEGMSRSISCHVVDLRDASKAPEQIDHAIWSCWSRKLPVYLGIPSDIARKITQSRRLRTAIPLCLPANDSQQEHAIVALILESVYQSTRSLVLVDSNAIRHNVLQEVQQFVDVFHAPTLVTPMGKGGINEQHPLYHGLYTGKRSQPHIRRLINTSNLIIRIGPTDTDFNTCGSSNQLSPNKLVDIHPTHVVIKGTVYHNLHMRWVLQALTGAVEPAKIASTTMLSPRPYCNGSLDLKQPILHDWFWPRLSGFLRKGDIVITESGTACFGIWDTTLPEGVTLVHQLLWCSIGYAVAACQGVSLAVRDAQLSRRVILFVGDGSLQVSVQELSTILWHGLTPIIFVICNGGYTTERYLGDENGGYNNINHWKMADLLSAFNGGGTNLNLHRATTQSDIVALFEKSELAEAEVLNVVELYMPTHDVPHGLKLATNDFAPIDD